MKPLFNGATPIACLRLQTRNIARCLPIAGMLGTLSAIVLAVLELVLAAFTLLRISVVIGIALVARILLWPQACAALCLCNVAEQGRGAKGWRGRATGAQQQGEPIGATRRASNASSQFSAQSGSWGECRRGKTSGSCRHLTRCHSWSEGICLAGQRRDCSKGQHGFQRPACIAQKDGCSDALPVVSYSCGQDFQARPTCKAPDGPPGSPSVILSSVHTESTPAGLTLQLSLTITGGASSSWTGPPAQSAGDAPGRSPPAEAVPEQWRAMEELQHELEEERSAAETAAAEALRMITRLQSEKAALAAQVRHAEQREQAAALQAAAVVEALEGALAQLEHERMGRRRRCRACAAPRWQSGHAGLALLDSWGEGWQAGRPIPVQVQPVVLERGSSGLLLTSPLEDGQWPRRKGEGAPHVREVNGAGADGPVHKEGSESVMQGLLREGAGGQAPAEQGEPGWTDGPKVMPELEGEEREALTEPGSRKGDAQGELAREDRGTKSSAPGPAGLAAPPCTPAGSGPHTSDGCSYVEGRALQRHLSLVSHPIVDDDPINETTTQGAQVWAASAGASQPHPGCLRFGEGAEGGEEEVEGGLRQPLGRADERGRRGEPDGQAEDRSAGEVKEDAQGQDDAEFAGVGPIESASQAPMGKTAGAGHLLQGGPHPDQCGERPEFSAHAGRLRKSDRDRGQGAIGKEAPVETAGGDCTPPAQDAGACNWERTAAELHSGGGGQGLEGADVTGELAGKLASRRKWEQLWEGQGRQLWTSPSVVIKERPGHNSVRRTLFSDGEGTHQDLIAQPANVGGLSSCGSEQSRIGSSGASVTSSIACSKGRGGTTPSHTQPPETPEILSAELAMKLASRRKWEVQAEAINPDIIV